MNGNGIAIQRTIANGRDEGAETSATANKQQHKTHSRSFSILIKVQELKTNLNFNRKSKKLL